MILFSFLYSKIMSRFAFAPQHAANCYWRERGGCPICSEVFGTVCWHAKTCSDARCTVPYCQTIRRCLVREIIRERA